MKLCVLSLVPLALCLACSPPPTCNTIGVGGAGTGGAAGGGDGTFDFRDDSSAVSVDLFPQDGSASGGCSAEDSSQTVKAERASAVVVDPFNDEVESTTTFHEASGFPPASATVTFAPKLPGSYHVTVTFAPVGGRAQKDLVVVKDRRGVQTVRFNRSCVKLVSKLKQGTLLCDGEYLDNTGTLKTWYAGAYSISGISTDGQNLWTFDNAGQIHRYVETGLNAISHDPTAGSPAVSSVVQLVPGTDEAIAIGDSSFTLLRASTGGIAQVASYSHGMVVGSSSGALRSGKFLLLAETTSDTASIETSGPDTRVCAFDLQSLETTGDPKKTCQQFRGTTFAANPEGIWTWQQSGSTLKLLAPLPDGSGMTVVQSLTLSGTLGAHTNFDPFHPGRVYFQYDFGNLHALFLPRRSDSGIILEHYDNPSTNTLSSSESALWSDDGSTLAYLIP